MLTAEFWQALAIIVPVLGTLGGLIYTQRQGGRASDRTLDLTEKSETVKGWEALTARQSEQLTSQAGQLVQLWDRLRTVENDRATDAAELRKMRGRLDDVESRYRAAVRYVVRLRAFIAQHLPGEDPPQPPVEVQPDLAHD